MSWLGRFNRAMLLILMVPFVAALALLGGYVGRPLAEANQELRINQEIERRILQTERENEYLRREHRRLTSREGLEEEARSMGYVRKGEARILFTK